MKKLLILNTAISIMIISGSGFTVSRQGDITASIKRGEVVYTQTCLPCHQANGRGVPNLNPPLVNTKWVLGAKEDLIKVILKGMTGEIEVNEETYNNNMPPHEFLTDLQIADVLTYVRNSFGNKASAIKEAEVTSVRAKSKTAG